MADPVTEIKNESRIIQQKIYNLEQKVNALESYRDSFNKMLELENKLNRLENLIKEKFDRVCTTTENTQAGVERIRNEMQLLKEKPAEPKAASIF